MIRHLVVSVPLIMFLCVPSLAQKSTIIRGVGTMSCANYIQAYDAYRPFIGNETGIGASVAIGNYEQYEAWIQGYLFGVDSWNKRQVRQFDRAAMQVWVYDYCQKHPLALVANAALAFYREIGGPVPTGGDRTSRLH
jgi:hypothetical protein